MRPDGYAQNLADGIIRACYRESRAHPSPIAPGMVYDYTIDLWSTSVVLHPGHRLRVEIASANFPRFDRNPNTAHPLFSDTELQAATQTIFHDAVRPSHIVLPVAAMVDYFLPCRSCSPSPQRGGRLGGREKNAYRRGDRLGGVMPWLLSL